MSIWIPLKLRFCFFFFTRFGVMQLLYIHSLLNRSRKCWFIHSLLNRSRKCWLFHGEQCIRALFTDPQILLFSNFFIKNGSHGTIHIFKNYFVTMFSVFNFQFYQNKFYPNRPLVSIWIVRLHLAFFFFFSTHE